MARPHLPYLDNLVVRFRPSPVRHATLPFRIIPIRLFLFIITMLLSTIRAALRTPATLTANAARAFRRADHIRCISGSPVVNFPTNNLALSQGKEFDAPVEPDSVKPGHAVISTFDLFSIGGEYLLRYCPCGEINLLFKSAQAAHIQSDPCARGKYSSQILEN